jgi:hypothetical protein
MIDAQTLEGHLTGLDIDPDKPNPAHPN